MSLYDDKPARRIDYELMKRDFPKHKSALTRAEKSGSPLLLIQAIEKALDFFDACGAWPDDWSRWKRALEDGWLKFHREGTLDGALEERYRAVGRRFQ